MIDYPEPSCASANGIELAYEVFGCDGGPTVVWANALGPNLDAFSDMPGWWIERIAGFSRVVAFDRRGQGLSTRTFGFGTLEDRSARVCALASPGELLVTSMLRDLVAGSGLVFEPRGSHKLTGIPGAFQLFAVVS